MLCLQAYLFLIELRLIVMALLATVSMMTSKRGVGQTLFPFLMEVDASLMAQLFPEIQPEATDRTQDFILGYFRFKGHLLFAFV